jgi:hypothetical protein
LPVQIVSAFVTDLLLRAFKHSSGFTLTLPDFVVHSFRPPMEEAMSRL